MSPSCNDLIMTLKRKTKKQKTTTYSRDGGWFSVAHNVEHGDGTHRSDTILDIVSHGGSLLPRRRAPVLIKSSAFPETCVLFVSVSVCQAANSLCGHAKLARVAHDIIQNISYISAAQRVVRSRLHGHKTCVRRAACVAC